MSPNEAHKALGLSPDAHQGDLVKAYRRLAMKHHPDRNNNSAHAEERFKEIKEAYELLLDILPLAPKPSSNAVMVSVSAGSNPYASEYAANTVVFQPREGFHACA